MFKINNKFENERQGIYIADWSLPTTTRNVDTSGEVYTTVTDAALASQIATYWNFFATSGF